MSFPNTNQVLRALSWKITRSSKAITAWNSLMPRYGPSQRVTVHRLIQIYDAKGSITSSIPVGNFYINELHLAFKDPLWDLKNAVDQPFSGWNLRLLKEKGMDAPRFSEEDLKSVLDALALDKLARTA